MKKKYIKLSNKIKFKKKENIKNEKEINYGLAILKSFLALLVIMAHCFDTGTTKNKIIFYMLKYLSAHVSSFFIISFYFTSSHLSSLKIKKNLERLMRLLIPFIGWPLIILKINKIFNKKYNKSLQVSYEALKNQLLWGCVYLDHFWFLWDMIVITISFFIIIFIFRKHFLFILQIILIMSYISQYSGYNFNKNKNFPYHMKYPLGRIAESVTYSITGFILGYYKVIDLLQKHKIKTIIISAMIYEVMLDYHIFSNIMGFGYQGIDLNIKSICLILVFAMLPFEIIKNKEFKKIIRILTNYSGGVYYLHISFSQYLSVYFDDVKKRNFKGILINYAAGYITCFVGTIILGKTPLKYLFC